MLTHGLVDAKSKKGEDAPAMATSGSAAAFAIFDGHGGKFFSHICAHLTDAGINFGAEHAVLPKLLAAGDGALPSDQVVDEIFWKTDADVGAMLSSKAEPNLGGCTAQVLMTLPVAGGVQMLQAWVGDSTALTVDMSGRGKLVHATFNHNPSNVPGSAEFDEAAPLLHMAEVSKACRKRLKKTAKKQAKKEVKRAAKEAKKTNGTVAAEVELEADDDDDNEDDDEGDDEDGKKDKDNEDLPLPSAAMIKEVLVAMQHADTSDAHIGRLLRAFAREKLICEHLPSGGKYRRDCFIYRRPFEKDENMPITVHKTADPFRGHHADMMMTRSLGDWKHVSWILPTPQVHRSAMRPTDHYRVVLASDGLWDVVSHEQALALTRAAPTAHEAAEELLAAAKRVYLEDRGLELPGDDTTVLVVDLNPSKRSFVPPPTTEAEQADGGGGCCTVA